MGNTDRAGVLKAAGLVIIGSLGVQSSALVSMLLFDDLGAAATSTLRFLVAAVILLVAFRPKIFRRRPDEWPGVIVFGVAMATANLLLYFALDRIPLGVAVTIQFLGPCMVALFGSRSIREGALALVAFAGVALIAGFGGSLDLIGLLFAAGSATAFGMYTLFAARIGKSTGGVKDVALAVTIGAIVTLPISVPAISGTQPKHWLILFISATIGMAIPFSVDTLAGKVSSARVIGVLFAMDPVVSTLLGFIFAGQVLVPTTLGGIALVVLAGAGIVWFSGSTQPASIRYPRE